VEALLDARDYALASSLTLAARRRLAGFAAGEQRSPSTGGGIEFAEYRPYAPGDEPRRIDWSLFLRWRKLMVKLAAEEKELTLAVLIDASRSMDYGSPGKLRYAKRLACILAGAALSGGNRASIAVMGASLVEALPPERGKLPFPELVKTVERIQPSAGSSPAACARQFSARYGGKCLALVLSDFLYPDWPAVVGSLGASGSDVLAVQILSPDELEPLPLGEALLQDSEDGDETPLHIDAPTAARYRDELAGFTGELRAACARKGMAWALASTERDPASLLKGELAGRSFIC